MYLQRMLDLKSLLKKKSFFLLGPRLTGKTSLIRHQLGDDALIIDLLRSEVFSLLTQAPWQLESIIHQRKKHQQFIVIDEIQKLPLLLNEVHRLIEEKDFTFLLTGSSARKLRHKEVNLLGGRAWQAELFPLIKKEIPDFLLSRYLITGGLPNVYLSDYPEEELSAYAQMYQTQEVYAESLVRKIEPFTKFLRNAALMNGKLLNYTEIGSDAGVSPNTIREYYQILEDTLLGKIITPWMKSIKRKAVSTAKFYFFDIGIRNHFAQIKSIDPGTDGFGQAFEQFIFQELRAYLSYTRKKVELTFWLTKHSHEVDFIIGDGLAIEVKSSMSISDKHCKGLRVLQEENFFKKYILVSLDKISRTTPDNIEIIYYELFLENLWNGEYDQDY